MGLSYSRLGAHEKGSADGISPEDVRRGNPAASYQVAGEPKAKEAAPEDLLDPTPSVVIEWVLNDVFRTYGERSRDENLMREVQLEAHAQRLQSCWEIHGDDFATSFVEVLMARVQNMSCTDSKLTEVYPFLVGLFGGCTRGPLLHIIRGSQELWPFGLDEIRRKHEQLTQGAERAAPETVQWRQNILGFLGLLKYYTIRDENLTEASKTLKKAIEKVSSELSLERAKGSQEQAARKAEAGREAKEAELKARGQQFKASLKRAPWDKEAVAGKGVKA